MKKKRYITICPKCESNNINIETNPAYAITGLINQFKECRNCGYRGQVFPEVLESEVPKKPKKIEDIKDRTLIEPTFGKGYSKYFKYIVLPFLIIFAILFFASAIG